MNRNRKLLMGAVFLILGLGLIGWNLRDPDRAYREPEEQERNVTMEQVPKPVQAAISRLTAGGGKIEEIKEEREGGTTTYEVDTIRGDTKTEFEIAEDGSVLKQKSKKSSKRPAR
jgi:uncharacterized membrane protein YkoI